MTAIEQADVLTQQAIDLLLAERQRIDNRLTQLGNKKGPAVKRGRPLKSTQPLISAQPCMTDERAS
jgi:hypothetical protein